MIARSITLGAVLAAAVAALGCDGKPTGPNGSIASKTHDECLGPDGKPLPIADDSRRVDLGKPSFTNPTNVTNPLFPIGRLFRGLLFGNIDGVALRIETTLLPETKVVKLKDESVEVLVSQFAAFLGGRIHEVAIDRYAQADDGSVWYLGEDVFNYEDGLVADTEGTWLAGRDGPAAMIMPANPQVGDVWRTENICGLVFEEVTAKATGRTVQGPTGPVSGALVVQELHQDGALEPKTFAPGYGEFVSGGGNDLEALALAVPTDALPGLPPKELETLSSGAAEIFDAAQAEDWEAMSATVGDMTAAWDAFRAGDIPPMLKTQMDGELDTLVTTVKVQDPAETRQAAIDVARASLDLQLRYRTAAETDLDLLDLWARQLVLDAEAGDQNAVIGDAASIRWTRDRIARDVAIAELRQIDARIEGLRAAAAVHDLTAIRRAAAGFRATLKGTRVIGRGR